VVGTTETFIRERPIPAHPAAGGTHYGRGRPEDPTGAVTNEDYAGMLCEFASGARGTFESSRSIVGPESQMAFDVHGTRGALGWNLEKLNELQVYLAGDGVDTGYRTVFGGDRFPYHGNFVPGSANGIGFEDLVVIEDYEFCRSVAEGRPHRPGFEEAVEWVSVQAALLQSVQSGQWEPVVSLRED
jgi:predicted dehydrogenase